MPLPIRDGNQSLTTLSTLIVNSAHVPAHTVVSLGSQAITDIAGAVSGVELGPNTINALENIHVSISAGSSITVGNVVSVTGGLTNAELRASSVTIGGSVSVLNFPNTQTVTFTQASVTFGQAVVSASNISNLNDSVGTDGANATSTKFVKIGGHQDGQNQVEHIVHVSAGGAMKVDASDSSVTFGLASVTFSAVSISNFPATQVVSVSNLPATQTIAGTVTANIGNYSAQVTGNAGGALSTVTAMPVALVDRGVYGGQIMSYDGSNTSLNVSIKGTVPAISGTVTANVGNAGVYDDGGDNLRVGLYSVDGQTPASWLNDTGGAVPISGTVTVGNTVTIAGTVTANPTGTQTIAGTVTIGSLPTISGTVTANINGTVPISISSVTIGNSVTIASFATSVTARLINPAGTAVTYAEVGTAGNPSIDVLSVQGVSGGTNLPIAGSVTISGVPGGALTTRFGSVTTANTAQISSAVTNTARRYLLIQNVTTSSNVITVGVGFTPTTTQGIQLTAGAGITFESSYIPTGAVYILSSVTASLFTILEA